MARPEKIEPWFAPAAELMARTGCSLKDAATILEIPIDSDQAARIVRRSSFNHFLWAARHTYAADLAKDPNFSQDSVVGRLLILANKLEEEGSADKAAEVLLKLAKIRGWCGPESQVSVFSDLSQADLDQIREKLAKQATPKPSVN